MVFKSRQGRIRGASVTVATGMLGCLLAATAAAQSITGTTGELNDGQRITVNGFNFGSRGAAWYYENFEGASTRFDTTTNPGLNDPSISAEHSWNGNQSLKCQLGDPQVLVPTTQRNGYGIYWFPRPLNPGEKLYISFWERWNWGSNWPVTGGSANVDYQIKNWRITGGPNLLQQPWIGQNNQSNCDEYGTPEFGPRTYVTRGNSVNTSETTWLSRSFEPEFTNLHNTWMQWEILVTQCSPVGADNGSIEIWITRAGRRVKVMDLQGWATQAVGDPGYNKQSLGDWIDSGGISTALYYDNYYIDNSWQRVVLGDAGTYASCVIREPQPFVTWEDQGIDLTLVTSGFEDGQEAWLYVVDANGNPSAGHRIVIGESGSGGGDLGPPGAATNVRHTP